MIYIILPVHNEEKTINDTIDNLRNFIISTEIKCNIIFVDDYSTDRTFSLIESKGAIVTKNILQGGKGSALRHGYNYILLNAQDLRPHEEIVFLDGDGQLEIYDLSTGMKKMRNYSCSVSIGNKRHIYSISSYNLTRNIISKTYNLLINFLFDLNVADTQCGFKIFRYHVLKEVMDKITVNKFAFDLELLIAIKEKGIRIVDFPIHMREQQNKGSVNLKNIFETFLDTIKIYIRYKTNYYKK